MKERQKMDGSVQGMVCVGLCRSFLRKWRKDLSARERVGFSAVVRRPAERCQERVSDVDDQTTTMYKAEAEKKKNKNSAGYSQRKRSESK